MLYSLGLIMARYRWTILTIWTISLIVALFLAPMAQSNLKAGFGESDVESRRGLEIMEEYLGFPEATLTILFSTNNPNLVAQDPLFKFELEKSIEILKGYPDVTRIITPYDGGTPAMISPNGKSAYAIVLLNTSIDESMDKFYQLRDMVKSSELEVLFTGGIAIFADLNKAIAVDLRRAETIALPIVLVVLVVVYGSLIAACLPIVIGGLSIAFTLAMVYGLSQITDVSIFVLNIASFLGLGIAIDYSLLVVNRFREELQYHPKNVALGITMSTAGKALLFSGLTTILGLSGLLFFDFMALRSIGIGGIFVVALSLLQVLTLLPALLHILGSRVNALAITKIRPENDRHWASIAKVVMRYPIFVIVPVMLILVILGIPFLRVQIGAPWASILPENAEARIGWEKINQEFGVGEMAPILVVVSNTTSFLGNPEAIGKLYDYVEQINSDPRVHRLESIVSLRHQAKKKDYQFLYSTPNGTLAFIENNPLSSLLAENITLIRVFEKNSPLSPSSKDLVRKIRGISTNYQFDTYVTGVTADVMDSVDEMYKDFPAIIAYVMVTTYIALFFLFRSIILPLKAITMNAMSIFASYGALVFIFQDGHFHKLLGFTPQGNIEATIPILMFCIVFGLSMDYEVFLLSRVKEFYDRTKKNSDSVAAGLGKTGRVITSAALIMALVSGSFATGEIVFVKALGIGTAIAILIDATVVRVLLVPSLMCLLGDWNWWSPKFLNGKNVKAARE